MTTRRVRRTVRRSGNGIHVVADVNAVLSTGGSASSSMTTTVTQRATPPDAVRRPGRTTRGDQ
jgi:hypothetical protein